MNRKKYHYQDSEVVTYGHVNKNVIKKAVNHSVKNDPNHLGTTIIIGRDDESIRAYKNAIQANKDDYKAHLLLAQALKSNEKTDESLAEYSECVNLLSKQVLELSHVYCQMGLIYKNKGEMRKFLSYLLKSLRYNQHSNPVAKIELGDYYFTQGNLKKACYYWRSVKREYKNNQLASNVLLEMVEDRLKNYNNSDFSLEKYDYAKY